MSQFSTAFTDTPVAILLYESYSVSDDHADEWYHVKNLPPGNKGNIALGLLPAKGTNHDVATGAIVRTRQYIESINEREQVWWVKYRRPVFGAAPSNGSRTATFDRRIDIPTYKLDDTITGASRFVESVLPNIPNSVQVRAITRTLGGSEAPVAQATATRVGKICNIDGVPYQYIGYSARDTTGSLLSVTYQFAQDAAIPAIPAGVIPGSDIPIPAKPALAQYFKVPPPSPEIIVRTYAQIFGTFNFSELP